MSAVESTSKSIINSETAKELCNNETTKSQGASIATAARIAENRDYNKKKLTCSISE